ncbi:MAG: hypothetical protein ACT4PT_07455, partial [Methanobacteriota archaeon]
SRARAAATGSREIRAWGEMVDILEKDGMPSAARKLEALWNEVIDAESIHLLCSYEADNLDVDEHVGRRDELCRGHTVLVPEPDYAGLEEAVSRALVDVFGERDAPVVRRFLESRRRAPIAMPTAEAVLVAICVYHAHYGARVLAATRRHLGIERPPGIVPAPLHPPN